MSKNESKNTKNITKKRSSPINLLKSKELKFNQEILKQIELLESENYQLKEALSELEKDLIEKDQSIEESQKIISKLKSEYAKVIKELQNMEKSYNELLDEMNRKSIEINQAKKDQSLLHLLKKKNNSLSTEKNNLHKENAVMRKKILSCGNISFKKEKDIKNKDFMIENLQKKNNKMVKMIKERENIIDEQSKKIMELNEVINNKNKEMKILMNISKEINKENKINVKELTKQAVKTIKTFQNNNKNRNFSYDLNSKFFLDVLENNNNNKNTFENFENIFKNNKGAFSLSLEDAINEALYIPDNLKIISKEFLASMNFKTELIKNELYSSLIREAHFINFLRNIFGKLFKDKKDFLNLFQDILTFKTRYLGVIKENNKLKLILYNNNINMEKIKENIHKNNSLIKNIFIRKEKEIENLKNEIQSLNAKLTTNSANISNNNNNSNFRHLSTNNFKKRVKSFGEIGLPDIWNTLPTLERDNNTESNIDTKDSYLIVNNNRICRKISQRKTGEKKLKNICTNINSKEIVNFNFNNSIEYNNNKSFKNENNNNNYYSNISNDYIYVSTINDNKDISKSEIKNKLNANYKKDIFNLQKEINNIINKSLINNTINITETNVKTPRDSAILTKIRKKDKNNVFKNIIKDKHNIFNCDFFIDIIFRINSDAFDLFELNKYRQIYNLSNINSIYLNFKKICNELKNKTDEINLKINKSYNLTETNFIEKTELKSERKNYIDKSFKFFNERIISLKKFEFEFINMNDYIKNYLVSQEITIKMMYNLGKNHIKYEPIEKLFNLFEDCLTYRINEMNDNIIFTRKLLIKLFKKQINCLLLSFEYNFD